MSWKLFVTVALLGGLAEVVWAQPRTLTIEQSIQLGLENSKSFHASQMKSEAADARASELKAALFPSLKVQASYTHLSAVPEFKIPFPGIPTIFPYIGDTYVAKATLQQPLFTGWRLRGAFDAADLQAGATRLEVMKDKAETILGIKTAYWNVYRAGETRRLAQESVGQVEAHLRDLENLQKQGMATENDVLRVKVQLANARILLSDASNALRLSTIALNSVIGLPLQTEIVIASGLSSGEKRVLEIEKLVEQALAIRPELVGMDLRVRAADAAVAAAAGGWFPQVFLTGNYYYARPNQRIIPSVDVFKDTWDFGVSVQFDLWNNLTTLHQTSQAKAQREQLRDVFGSMKDGVVLEVTQSALSYRQSVERVMLAELSVQQANEQYRMASEKFKWGLLTSSDLLDAEIMLLQSKLQLTGSQVDRELAYAKLERVAGW